MERNEEIQITQEFTLRYRQEQRREWNELVDLWGLEWSIWSKTKGRCWYCGIQCALRTRALWKQFRISHILLRMHGGNNSLDNCIPSCRLCSERRHHLRLEDFRNREAQHTFPFFGTLRFWGERQINP